MNLKHSLHIAGRRHFFRLVAVTMVVAMVFGVVSIIFKQNPTKAAFAGNYTAEEVVVAVNQERTKKNLPELKQNPKLMEAARNKVDDMILNNYFAHISPVDGKKWSSFIRNSGYDYIEAGENLANGFDNTSDLVTAWMNSPTHRDNILNPNVDEAGMAVKSGFLDGYPTIFVAQTFGKREVPETTTITKTETVKSTPKPDQTPAKNVAPQEAKPEVKKNLTPSQNQLKPSEKPPKIDKTKKLRDDLKLESEIKLIVGKIFE